VDFRTLTPDDWTVVREVRLRALADSPHAFTSTYDREVSFDESTWRDRARTCQWFVASEEGEPVGVAGGVDGWSGDPATRELVGMWVAPSHRGHGIARRLLDRVAEWGRSEGASRLGLAVRQGNDDARDAYSRMGFRPTGEKVAAWNHPGEFVEIMEMDLGRAH
jgi:GNAT superfamily N-acetyltransferase